MKRAPFAQRLTDLRVEHRWTQEMLAERTGLSVRGISDLERGVRHPRFDSVERIARALGIDGATLTAMPDRLLEIPAALDAFIGREDELASLGVEIRTPETRLLNLVGPPGTGKTRLARELAFQEEQCFPDGVVFIRLCVLRRTRDVPMHLARRFGLESFVALREHLAGKRFLLVLDNIEHLPDIADAIVTLLEDAPSLTILCTGRAPLNATGEHVRTVQPLGLPDTGETAAIFRAPSTRLFVARVRERFALPLTQGDAPALARIVAAVEGLPLAIELAAMCLATRNLDELSASVEYAVATVEGPADRPLRSRSLDGALAWSMSLLEPDARRFLIPLAAFVGTFSVDAAASVGGVPLEDAIRHVAVLRAMQLLVPSRQLELLSMLNALRSALLIELHRGGDFGVAREAHARWYRTQADAERERFDALAAAPRSAALRGIDDNVRYAAISNDEALSIIKT